MINEENPQTEERKDVENRDPEINYDELTVYRYVTDLSEDHIKNVLTIKHRCVSHSISVP